MSWLGATYTIPASVITSTREALLIAGREEMEAVVLWIGQRQGEHVEIVARSTIPEPSFLPTATSP